MSTKSKGINNIKHKSAEDKKNDHIRGAVKKLGGQQEADELLVHWENHRRSEHLSDRKKRESDGFLRGIILSQNLSRFEAMTFFKIGRYKFDRLRDLNPNQPVPKKRPNDNVITAADKEFVRVFMKAQEVEPGYPCHHRSTPVYMADPSITFVSLHNQYKLECQDRTIRFISYNSFRRVVKFIMPTLHLGKTKADSCNACFSLDLQIRSPDTSDQLRKELVAAKSVHLNDAIKMRQAISKLVKSVQAKVAPNDPPLKEDPVFIPSCFKDPFDRLNRPFVVDYEEGLDGDFDDGEADRIDALDNFNPGDEDNNIEDESNEDSEEIVPRDARVTVQDFGSGIPLPFYGANQPNHDYYASNITVHNMNFVECATGQCDISYYDERHAGKDGNSVSSLRWNNLRQFVLEHQKNLPKAEVKVLDNCVGQNKSNTTHKFSMLTSLLIFTEGVTDIYFRVGHSHNQSDQKTGHAAKALSKKNLYTPQAIAKEVNKVKGLCAEVLNDKVDLFQDWKPFLDKHFKNMDPGFTSFYIFQFKNGVVEYRELNDDGVEVLVKSKVFCSNPEAVRKVILRELFNLNPTSNPVEICKAKPRLPPLPQKRISEKKIDSMKTLYQQIPRQFRWFYPEGHTVQDDLHTDLRVRAAAAGLLAQQDGEGGAGGEVHHGGEGGAGGEVQHGGEGGAGGQDADGGDGGAGGEMQHGVVNQDGRRNTVGRPRKVRQASSNQPAIHRFFPIATAAMTQNLVGPTIVSSTSKTRAIVNRDFIEDETDEESDISSEEDVSDQVPKKRKAVDNIFGSDYDSDELFTLTDTEDIPAKDSEEGTGDNIESSDETTLEDSGATDKDSNNDKYSVDLNENLGRIVLKIHKKI